MPSWHEQAQLDRSAVQASFFECLFIPTSDIHSGQDGLSGAALELYSESSVSNFHRNTSYCDWRFCGLPRFKVKFIS
jgi:hypothetical protein